MLLWTYLLLELSFLIFFYCLFRISLPKLSLFIFKSIVFQLVYADLSPTYLSTFFSVVDCEKAFTPTCIWIIFLTTLDHLNLFIKFLFISIFVCFWPTFIPRRCLKIFLTTRAQRIASCLLFLDEFCWLVLIMGTFFAILD